jgi:hypothetical protein
MKQQLPFFEGTSREWRIHKRQEFKQVIKAFEDFRIGCAFTPLYRSGKIDLIEKLLKESLQELRGNWQVRK